MSFEDKVKFFDGIAGKWDGWEDLKTVAMKLSHGLDDMGVGDNETIVDVGCGTGNLTKALVAKLSPAGRVVAIDMSAEMVKRAREKVPDPRVDWHIGDAVRIPIDDSSVDRVICYSVWPHFDDPGAVVSEFKRILRQRGMLHIWHLSSRESINKIHSSAGEAVANDVLVPAAETALLLKDHGFVTFEIVDDDERYLVSAEMSPGKT